VRRRLAWGLALPLALTGSQAAHALAYTLVYPQAQVRATTLLTTGHAYLSGLPFALALAGAAAFVTLLASAVDAARLRPAGEVPAWAFALLAPATFVLQELLELSLQTGTLGWRAFLAPTFLPGLLLQLPFAAAAYGIARILLVVARRAGAAFVRRPRLSGHVERATASAPPAPLTRIAAAVPRPRAPPRLAV
jgi:hypothetical protein